jgi:hypothetical protein
MEDTPSHETAYKLAHRADKANFSPDCYPTFLGIVQPWGLWAEESSFFYPENIDNTCSMLDLVTEF